MKHKTKRHEMHQIGNRTRYIAWCTCERRFGGWVPGDVIGRIQRHIEQANVNV